MNNNSTNHDNEKHKAVDWKTKSSESRSASYGTHTVSQTQSDKSKSQGREIQIQPQKPKPRTQAPPSYSTSFARNNSHQNNVKIVPLVLIAIIVIIGIAFIISRIANKSDNKNEYKSSNLESSEYKEISSEKTDAYDDSFVNDDSNESVTDLETSTQSIYTIDAIPESNDSIDKIEIQTISDKITSEKERKTYDFTTGEGGRYRFELSEIPNNVYFKMFLYNSDMEELKYTDYQANGGGITYDLNANTQYHIVVEQQNNTGSYMLSIGSQKPTVDISNITSLSDSIQYTHQRNIYSFTSNENGRYRFGLSEIANNVYFKMFLYNSDMEELKYMDYQANDGGITYDLNGNSQYYIVVEQQNNTGSYTLNIGTQKATVDISEYASISDSVQFTHQRNIYSFTSSVANKYRFELKDVSNDAYFKMFIYNADMEELQYADYRGDGGEISFDLKSNTMYYIVIEQQNNIGHYTLSYGISNES